MCVCVRSMYVSESTCVVTEGGAGLADSVVMY